MTPVIAAWLAAMVVRMPTPVAPPPAAATAWACSAGGILPGGNAASLVNSAGLAWMTFSSGANFTALPSCVASVVAVAITAGGIFWAVATMPGCVLAKASWVLYWVA